MCESLPDIKWYICKTNLWHCAPGYANDLLIWLIISLITCQTELQQIMDFPLTFPNNTQRKKYSLAVIFGVSCAELIVAGGNRYDKHIPL